MESDTIKNRINDLREGVAPALAEIARLEAQHRDARSREWIAAHGVTRDAVELSSGEGRPYFGHVTRFAEWLAQKQVSAPWAEWNGRLYATQELIAGRMAHDAPGNYDHVPA